MGFMPALAAEIGYGKAVHHVMRILAELARETGKAPLMSDVKAALDREFFLPLANKVAHRELKGAAEKIVKAYVKEHGPELTRTWHSERPFELHLDGVTISGRADVIFTAPSPDGDGGTLTMVDYKTAAADDPKHGLQLQVYASAGRREGLPIAEAYVHDMKDARRIPVDLSSAALNRAESTVERAAMQLKTQEFVATPEAKKCESCDVKTVCSYAITKKK
jgi:DNA helicase-2/ATP-dependent DNA helicase PcrA